MEMTRFPENLVTTHWTTSHHNPEEHSRQTGCTPITVYYYRPHPLRVLEAIVGSDGITATRILSIAREWLHYWGQWKKKKGTLKFRHVHQWPAASVRGHWMYRDWCKIMRWEGGGGITWCAPVAPCKNHITGVAVEAPPLGVAGDVV
jgi:hypothetical protein